MTYKEAFLALVASLNAFNASNETSIRGLEGDVAGLNAKTTDLETKLAAAIAANEPVTQEHLDLAKAASTQAQAVADRFTALDALTPPEVPSPT